MVAGAGTLASAPPLAVAGTGGCSTVDASATAITTTMSVIASVPTSPQGSPNSSSDVGPTRTRTSENRRSNKPIMEKRRRARINNCLNELKTLILDAMKKDPARHSKLEKADILEMTVKHLESLQRQQVAMATASDPSITNKFRAGFTECAGEVGRFPGLDGPVKRRLLQHLSNCLNNSTPTQPIPTSAVTVATPAMTTTSTSTVVTSSTEVQHTTPVQVHILRTPDSNLIQGLQLVPTRLPNGDIALILPAARTASISSTLSSPASPSPSISSTSSSSSPLPMLIPIPNRSTLASPSPVQFDRLSVSSPQRQLTMVTVPAARSETPQEPINYRTVHHDECEDKLVISEDCDEQHHYESDRETMLHIPERDYYDESYEESESEYYAPQRPYSPEMPKPLALVTRRRCESPEESHWRPW